MKLSVVIPAHNEAGSIARDRRRRARRAAGGGDPLRDRGDRRRLRRRHARRSCEQLAARPATCARSARTTSAASATPCAPGSTASRATPWRSSWPTRPTTRSDLVLYYRVLEAGYDCAFGSRFMPGAGVVDYPRLKLLMNRVVNLGIRALFQPRLQRHDERVQGLPARGRRRDPAADVQALQPDGRDAAEGGHPRLLVRGRPHHVAQPPGGRVQARDAARWARATSSSSSTRSSSVT